MPVHLALSPDVKFVMLLCYISMLANYLVIDGAEISAEVESSVSCLMVLIIADPLLANKLE